MTVSNSASLGDGAVFGFFIRTAAGAVTCGDRGDAP